ncbi:protein kinase domain-containing protein [Streptomyces sp. NBC_01264]|uniref:serine/threonine-protein kinase n=1 Tax=Streptomyces sp. NBC_01264 TaxID=2903804 RepID=UPI00224F71A8|nr:serine/threonine-protein kinase [Streptomyces sp. NBC_01264]MCX4783153.1 serine/threonine-protein kinase [Streptomyces sp. NBC_01264]
MTLRDGDPRAIGGYVLIARLGSGGMGTVYSGRAASGRLVAVKLVHQQFADDPEFRTRFRQEVAAARRVSGAFTAAVVDADPDAERPWMATQLVPGRTLGARVKADGPLRGNALRVLALGLVEALRELHTTGVIHRDLKPDNVMLTDDGPRVIDFGISRAAGQQTLTSTGQILGTPPYMSPEQLSAPARVRASSDVFSLGSVLVFAATGRGPFDAESHYMTAYRVVSEAPDIGELADPLRAVVGACLAKEAAARPEPDELLAVLARIPAAAWENPLREDGDPGGEARKPSGAGTWTGSRAGDEAEPGTAAGAVAGARTDADADGTGGGPAGPAAASPEGTQDAGGPLTRPSGPPTGPAGQPAAPRPRRMSGPRRRALLTGVLVASLLVGGGYYFGYAPRDGGARDDGKAPSSSAGPSGTPGPSGAASRTPSQPTATGSLAPYLATDGGSPGGSRAYADSPARRPAGWRAWDGIREMAACVYAASSLVCTSPGTSKELPGDGLSRYDAATGEPLWGQMLQDAVDGQPPLVAPGAVSGTHTVIAPGDKGFTALDLVEGTPRWEFPTKEKLKRAVLDADGSRVFAVSASGTVTALETRYGKLLWQQKVSGSEDGYPALRVDKDRVYVQGRTQKADMGFQTFVTALDGATGKKLPFGTPQDGTRFSMPGTCETRGLTLARDLYDDTVLLCSKENGAGVLRGEPAHQRSADLPYAGITLSGPAVAGDKVYLMATASDGEPGFMELNQESGGAVWRIPLARECTDPQRPEAANAVVVTGGLAYVRCRTSGVVIDLASRKQTARFTVPGGVRPGTDGPSGFLVVGGIVFTPTAKGWSAVEPSPV